MDTRTRLILAGIGASVIIVAYLSGDTETARNVLRLVLGLVGV